MRREARRGRLGDDRMRLSWLSRGRDGEPASSETLEAEEIAEAIRRPTQRWVVLAGLVWRTAGLIVVITGAWVWLESETAVLAVTVLVLLINVALLVLLIRAPRMLLLLDSWVFGFLDVGAAYALNLWTSWMIPENTLYGLGQYRDLYSPYLWGTVTVWIGLRGALLGAAIALGGAVPLQVGMARLNQLPIDTSPLSFVDRNMWLLTSYVLGVTAYYFARRGASAMAREARRAGQEEQRAQMLRTMHASVLQTLEAVALRATAKDGRPEDRLEEIKTAVRKQAQELRRMLSQDLARKPGSLHDALRELDAEFVGRGLAVELVTGQLEPDSMPRSADALLVAAHEALMNALKHSGCRQVVMRAVSTEGGVQLTVRDHGRGFDTTTTRTGYGLPASITETMRRAGGHAVVSSTPGRGTKVTLWGPA